MTVKNKKNAINQQEAQMKLSRRSLLQLSAATVAVGAFGLPARAQAIDDLVIRQNLGAADHTVTAYNADGSATSTLWTCDLSHDYVSINADYRS